MNDFEWQIVVDIIIEVKEAFLPELHQSSTSKGLRYRSQLEDRCILNLYAILDISITICSSPDDLRVFDAACRHSWDMICLHGRKNKGIQFRGVENSYVSRISIEQVHSD